MITVNLLAATICFTMINGQEVCHPALVGKNTPVGEFSLVQRFTDSPGYGGDVIKFHETDKTVFAIHRVWVLNPKQQRLKRLKSKNPKERVITKGCVNVEPKVYKDLLTCCIDQRFVVK